MGPVATFATGSQPLCLATWPNAKPFPLHLQNSWLKAKRPMAHPGSLPRGRVRVRVRDLFLGEGTNIPFLRGVSGACLALVGCSSSCLATTARTGEWAAPDWAVGCIPTPLLSSPMLHQSLRLVPEMSLVQIH